MFADMKIDPDDYFTSGELADVLGVVGSAVSNWRKRGLIPEPAVTIKHMELWSMDQTAEIACERHIDLDKVLERLERIGHRIRQLKERG